MNATPIFCPHGKAISWSGISRPGEPLPLIEHCKECYPVSILLDQPKE